MMRRRRFLRLALTSTAAAIGGCVGVRRPLPAAAVADATRGNIVIDIHCHTFNAADLPVLGFLVHVVGVPMPVAKLIRALASGTPDPKREEDWIDQVGVTNAYSLAPTFTEPSRLEIETEVRDTLRKDPSLDRELAEKLDDEELRSEVDEVLRHQAPAAIRRRTLEHKMHGIGTRPNGSDTARRLVQGPWLGYLRWVFLLRQYRLTIIQTMFTTYPAIDLITPAMVDMGLWLNDSSASSIADQVRLYEKLIVATGGRLHPFVAFDPCRAADSGWSAAQAALEKALDMGCVGVKLYPPMGFRPSGNAEAECTPTLCKHDGKDIDQQLAELYKWCLASEVPIMAHCSDSNGADEGLSKRASPEYWQWVLENYPDLRVDLGHFGNDDDLIQNCDESWAWKIGRLMVRHRNLYGDTGYHSSVGDKKRLEQYLDRLTTLYGTYPAAADRLLFGTDWHMIYPERWEKDFLVTYRAEYSQVFDNGSGQATRGFMGGRAAEFLGLTSGRKNRTRLELFYRKHAVPLPAWWQKI